ncbi:hypothetical protein VC83_05213 [Pseudogymnoascus destructans]|uniref:Uncharacterized protein n=1 Tax=Pseudogymnoascus destructans TaxID=655981 RepID=A0A177AA64_9PEZI|nr:uncharacterized protein VC83_05213 [Pseudogymnoascus destructans]OAF58073.1 hypothetical protein VC83_05213 [Pseudogymnoascus destructans]
MFPVITDRSCSCTSLRARLCLNFLLRLRYTRERLIRNTAMVRLHKTLPPRFPQSSIPPINFPSNPVSLQPSLCTPPTNRHHIQLFLPLPNPQPLATNQTPKTMPMPKAPAQTNRLLRPNHHLAADPTYRQVQDLLIAGGTADAGFDAEGFEGGGGVLGKPAEGAEEA